MKSLKLCINGLRDKHWILTVSMRKTDDNAQRPVNPLARPGIFLDWIFSVIFVLSKGKGVISKVPRLQGILNDVPTPLNSGMASFPDLKTDFITLWCNCKHAKWNPVNPFLFAMLMSQIGVILVSSNSRLTNRSIPSEHAMWKTVSSFWLIPDPFILAFTSILGLFRRNSTMLILACDLNNLKESQATWKHVLPALLVTLISKNKFVSSCSIKNFVASSRPWKQERWRGVSNALKAARRCP